MTIGTFSVRKELMLTMAVFLVGCTTSGLKKPGYEVKKSMVEDFIQNERWRGAYSQIERSFLLDGKPEIALQYFRDYPEIVTEGGVIVFRKGCNSSSESLMIKRENLLRYLFNENVNEVTPLLNELVRCKPGREKYKSALERKEANKIAEEERGRAREERAEKALVAQHKTSMQESKIKCLSHNCKRLFSLAQIFVNENSDMKIQISTDTIIQTYNPTDIGDVGMTVYNVPLDNKKGEVRLKIHCKAKTELENKVCMFNEISLYNKFKPFINGF